MAVFTKINKEDIDKIENSFKLGKIINYHGIKKVQRTLIIIYNLKIKRLFLQFLKKSKQ